jgi:hypothetical protein
MGMRTCDCFVTKPKPRDGNSQSTWCAAWDLLKDCQIGQCVDNCSFQEQTARAPLLSLALSPSPSAIFFEALLSCSLLSLFVDFLPSSLTSYSQILSLPASPSPAVPSPLLGLAPDSSKKLLGRLPRPSSSMIFPRGMRAPPSGKTARMLVRHFLLRLPACSSNSLGVISSRSPMGTWTQARQRHRKMHRLFTSTISPCICNQRGTAG